MSYSHSFELPEISDACGILISRNAEHLINNIYENATVEPFDNPVIRVGLVLKTLLRTGNESAKVTADCIEPATSDLMELISNAETAIERKIYTDELKFLRSCTLLDDLISLNTTAM